MKTITFVVALCLASIAYAQSPIPGGVRVGDGWVPCDHPLAIAAGLGCVAKTPTTSVPPPCVTIGTATVCSADQSLTAEREAHRRRVGDAMGRARLRPGAQGIVIDTRAASDEDAQRFHAHQAAVRKWLDQRGYLTNQRGDL